MSDAIRLKNMIFFGYHGVNDGERRDGQRFQIDLDLGLDVAAAGASDRLEDALDYTKVYAVVRDVVEKEQYQLLEALASRIAAAALGFGQVETVRVRVRKPAVPLPGALDYVEVEVARARS